MSSPPPSPPMLSLILPAIYNRHTLEINQKTHYATKSTQTCSRQGITNLLCSCFLLYKSIRGSTGGAGQVSQSQSTPRIFTSTSVWSKLYSGSIF